MKYIIQWILSLIFVVQMYLAMVIFAVVFLIPMLIHPRWAVFAARSYCYWVFFSARWIVGLRVEIRGTPPMDEVMVAAKHQSFFDIIVIFSRLPWGKFIMKKSLLYTPIIGQYAYRLGCVPVDRGKRAQTIQKMLADVKAGHAMPGQLVIYPQGTRVAPGDKRPYKIGAGILYQELGQPCVPVATNIGLFWPKHGIYRRRGTAVVEFLDPIPPGLPMNEFMEQLETVVETRSDALMAEVDG